MNYSIGELREKILKFIDYDIESKEQKIEKEFLDILLELSSEWGFISSLDRNAQFQKEYLKNMLARIEGFMNVENEEDF